MSSTLILGIVFAGVLILVSFGFGVFFVIRYIRDRKMRYLIPGLLMMFILPGFCLLAVLGVFIPATTIVYGPPPIPTHIVYGPPPSFPTP